MDAQTIGGLMGRLLFSYLLVWLVLFLYSRFKYRLSVRRTHSPGGLTAILIVFLLPLASRFGAVL